MWSASKQEATVNLWDIFDKGATANSSLQPVCILDSCRGRISDISCTVDANENALLALGCMDGTLTIIDMGSRTVLSQIREAHVDPQGMPSSLVLPFAKGNQIFFGYFDPENNFVDNENK